MRGKLTKLRTRLAERRALRQIRRAGVWFVDIPRTSSSSIRTELGRRYGPAYGKTNLIETEHALPQVFGDHMPAVEMRDRLGPRAWNRLFSFTVVRNPWDRILSLYHYRRKAREIPDDWSFPDFVARLVEAGPTTPYFQFHGLRYGAADFVLDETGAVIVDEIVRYEDRAAGIARVGARIGMPDLGGVRLQSASPPDQSYREIYDDATRELVAARFPRDLDLFGYAF